MMKGVICGAERYVLFVEIMEVEACLISYRTKVLIIYITFTIAGGYVT